MASKSENKPPPGPSHSKYSGDEVPVEKRRRIGNTKMSPSTVSRTQTRQAFSVINGGQDPPPTNRPPSSSGSDCGVIEFTKEDVEALLSEKPATKNKFNYSYKEKREQTGDCIKRLKQCVKWFQQLEGNYVTEQEKLKNLLELSEKKCSDMELLMKKKEDELNSIITELRINFDMLQEKHAKGEQDKSDALGSLAQERESKLAAEKVHASLLKELKRTQEDNASNIQKIQSLNDADKRLQEYNTSLQQYNSSLQSELHETNKALKHVEEEKAAVIVNLSVLRGHYSSLQEQLGTLRGDNSSLQEQLGTSRGRENEAIEQQKALASEVTSLKGDLQQIRDDRDRQLSLVEEYKVCAGKSIADLGIFASKVKDLEEQLESAEKKLESAEKELESAKKKLKLSDISATETRFEFDEQKRKLAAVELQIIEGENYRKELHNEILELKGNIRVFCRVRPLLSDDGVGNDTKVISFPTSTKLLGRGIDLTQNDASSGQTHSFTFDKVFIPDTSQEEVFVEISQLVQSALDGYKVCIFAYGQTGSGKTYTMMGKPEPDKKGLIPRTSEQVFETRQNLQDQGWKYEMQVSMLEIYNETIRDLLVPNKSGFDASRPENGKQYNIKLDSNGNTHVSDLTVVDVRSSKEVFYLLDRAAQSRSVGKTQMNEQSSRSHFVFTLRIMGFNERSDKQVQGVLNLIDLAGSERLSKSGSTGDRLKETQAINKSLSSLSDVIFALAKKDEHVPYRNSKLTHLLKPCLGGNSKTLMFVNISPDPSSVGESLCSLRFAERVNGCEIGVPRRQTSLKYSSDSRLSMG